jgi:MFS family permease
MQLYWLLPPFLLFSLAFGGLLVPKLNLVLSLVCREYLFDRSVSDPNFIFAPVVLDSDNPQCRIPEVQALVSKFTLYIMIIGGSLSAVMAPKLGALSDRYGRKRLIVVTSFGMFLTEIITILAAKYPDTVHYKWLLVGAIFDGLCGSFTSGMALTHAYAADCTAPPKRAVAFGYFHACLFTGIAIGPLVAALLIKVSGELITIFYVALGVHTVFIFFVLFVVPESLSKKRQILAREKHHLEGERLILTEGHLYGDIHGTLRMILRNGNILAPLKILWPTGPGSSGHLRANLILLSAVDTIVFGVAMGSMTVVVYYLGYQFGWDTTQTSAFMSVVNIVRVSALIIVLPLLNYLVRTRRANRQRRESGSAIPESNSGSDILDLSIIRVAIGLEALGYCGYAIARTGPLFVLSGILAACGGVGSPTLQSALTKHVPHDRVGQLLGATGLLHALSRIVAPTIFNLIYAGTVGTFPQAVFTVLTGCFGVAFLVSWFIRPNGKSSPSRVFELRSLLTIISLSRRCRRNNRE